LPKFIAASIELDARCHRRAADHGNTIQRDERMRRAVQREPQDNSKEEFRYAAEIPHRLEFVRGVIGPFPDAARLVLLANWGADDIIRLTGTTCGNRRWPHALQCQRHDGSRRPADETLRLVA
jgi:hypothetical protein